MTVPAVPAERSPASPHASSAAVRGTEGSGLGLAIVAAIADRLGTELILRSPRPGQDQGFEAAIRLPVEARQLQNATLNNNMRDTMAHFRPRPAHVEAEIPVGP